MSVASLLLSALTFVNPKAKYDLANDGFMGYVQTEENRWEYQKVVEGLSRKDDAELSAKKAEKKDFGVKL